jgi:hypothetical protein
LKIGHFRGFPQFVDTTNFIIFAIRFLKQEHHRYVSYSENQG